MNWKLIFRLSLFGLAMAFATISLIPENIEFVFWIVIFVLCAYLIVKNCEGKYFLHGFLVCLVNCVWITGVHLIFRQTYVANHPAMVSMGSNMLLAQYPRRQMLLLGPLFGAASGVILGLFAFVAGKLIKKPAKA
jgi:hypothetical protein